jgi:hypothetical protein
MIAARYTCHGATFNKGSFLNFPDSLPIIKSDCSYPEPKKAVRLAFVPGLGQAYNRDYWKTPIVLLTIAGGIYSYKLNDLKYQDYLSAYKQFYNLDNKTETFGGLDQSSARSTVSVRIRNLFNTKIAYRDLTHDMVARNKDYWRRNRNISLIATGVIYSLSIMEAYVAAHLKSFDISNDLSVRMAPKVSQPMINHPVPGVRVVFNLR